MKRLMLLAVVACGSHYPPAPVPEPPPLPAMAELDELEGRVMAAEARVEFWRGVRAAQHGFADPRRVEEE